jgi:hypothetical protein
MVFEPTIGTLLIKSNQDLVHLRTISRLLECQFQLQSHGVSGQFPEHSLFAAQMFESAGTLSEAICGPFHIVRGRLGILTTSARTTKSNSPSQAVHDRAVILRHLAIRSSTRSWRQM